MHFAGQGTMDSHDLGWVQNLGIARVVDEEAWRDLVGSVWARRLDLRPSRTR
jgi:hypothetical protein